MARRRKKVPEAPEITVLQVGEDMAHKECVPEDKRENLTQVVIEPDSDETCVECSGLLREPAAPKENTDVEEEDDDADEEEDDTKEDGGGEEDDAVPGTVDDTATPDPNDSRTTGVGGAPTGVVTDPGQVDLDKAGTKPGEFKPIPDWVDPMKTGAEGSRIEQEVREKFEREGKLS